MRKASIDEQHATSNNVESPTIANDNENINDESFQQHDTAYNNNNNTLGNESDNNTFYNKTSSNWQLRHTLVKDWPDNNLTALQKYAKLSITTYHNRMHSPKVITTQTSRKTNGIPCAIAERLRFISALIKNETFEKYFNERPPRKTSTLQAVTEYITAYYGPKGDIETFAMIFYYICNEIAYDVNGHDNGHNNSFHQSAEAVFRNGIALAEGFCNLFEHFCNAKRLRIRRLYGNCLLMPKHPHSQSSNININSVNAVNNYNSINNTKRQHQHQIRLHMKLPLTRKDSDNHVWNAIFFKNEWYPCDVVLGAGGAIEKHPHDTVSHFNPYYFLTPPEFMIMSHRPSDDAWQLTRKTCTETQFTTKRFIDYGKFYQQVYEHDITLLTHEHPIITHPSAVKPLVIKLQVRNIVLQCELYASNGKDKIQEVKYDYTADDHVFTLEPQFPSSNAVYVIRVLGRSSMSTDLIYYHLLDYRVRVGIVGQFTHFDKYKAKAYDDQQQQQHQTRNMSLNNNNNTNRTSLTMVDARFKKKKEIDYIGTRTITDYNKVFPSKTTRRVCFDNEGAYVYEPRTAVLKQGSDVNFRVRVKGAIAVAVLDGRKWTYLHKVEDNIYEGRTIITSDNVSICSLKACNVYTEVFRFKVRNVLRERRSLLLLP